MKKKNQAKRTKDRLKRERRTRGEKTLEAHDIICHNCNIGLFHLWVGCGFLQKNNIDFCGIQFYHAIRYHMLHAPCSMLDSSYFRLEWFKYMPFLLFHGSMFRFCCVDRYLFFLKHLWNRSIKQRLPLQSNDCVFLKWKHHWNECFSFIFSLSLLLFYRFYSLSKSFNFNSSKYLTIEHIVRCAHSKKN